MHLHSLILSGLHSSDDFLQFLEMMSKQSQHHSWPIVAASVAGDPDAKSRAQELLEPATCAPPYLNGSSPLHEQYVVKVAAGIECSLALTGCGEVWTFGLGNHLELATGNYMQTDPRPITGQVAGLIAENGGAVDIAVGDDFCLALARNGSVVMWGQLAITGHICNAADGLPGMIKIAAGRHHALLSDGEYVWQYKVDCNAKPGFDSLTRLIPQVGYHFCPLCVLDVCSKRRLLMLMCAYLLQNA
jgi:hypothetical protein